MTALKLTGLLFLMSAFETGFIDAIPSGYTNIGSTRAAYYKYHTENVTWPDAASTCRSEGARLFHPDSAEELKLVLRELAVSNASYSWIHSGISDSVNLKEYVTVDGRPVSQVYNRWAPGQPDSCGGLCRCGFIYPSTHLLYVYGCNINNKPFICKHEEEVTATDVTTVTAANASYVAAIEQQLANQTVAVEFSKQEAASLKLQLANRTAAIEVMQKEMEALKKVYGENQPCTLMEKIVVAIENQAAAFKQIAEADANQTAAMQEQTKAFKQQSANQTAALKQIAEADANQAAALEALQRHAANQTAAVERLALAMEKLAGTQENNEQ